MKRFFRNLGYLWPMMVLVLGMHALFGPYIDGWCEVFCPRMWYELSGLLMLWGLLRLAAFAVHCIYSIFVFFRREPLKYKIYVAIPLVILPLMWGVLRLPGLTYTNRRISSFKIGGWTRMMWAGGPSKVRGDALELIDASSDEAPPESEWPASIRALGAIRIEVDRKSRALDVAIPPATPYSDQFGFLIQDVESPVPRIVDGPLGGGHRIWKLADGIYLYEEW